MLNPVLLGIAENVVFLLAVVLVFDVVAGARPVTHRGTRNAGIGFVLGLIAVGTMMTSLRYEPGLIFDARSVVLGIAGLFFGAAAAFPAVLVAGAYRVLHGGPGMWTGLGVIAASGTLGVMWGRLRRGPPMELRFVELYTFGLVLHLGVLALLFTLPDGRGPGVAASVGPPMLLFYPLATAFVGILLLRRRRRERTTTRLAESEARYRTLFEESRSILLIVDPEDGRLVHANRSAVQFYGYDPDALRGMPLTRLNSLEPGELEAELERCVRGERERFEYRHRLADGSERHVEVHCGPIPIDGRVLLLFTVRDVTERHEAEQALREQGELLRLRSAALEAAANPIVITDRSGVIDWVNPAFTRLTGYTSDEALGRTPGELIGSGEHDEPFYRDLWTTIREGRVWQGEMVNRTKDGTIYHEDQTITPVLDDSGAITHFVAIKQDLTDRFELQKQIVQAQKMEAVGQLAGGVAHDFNNLLTVINGTAQLALEDTEADGPLGQELREILDAGTRAARLTRQLLTFSRRENVVAEVVDLNRIIENTGDMLHRLLSDRILLDLRLSAEPALVLADPGRLEQVLLNLTLNAQDAMPDGGRITLETRVVPGVDPASNGSGSPGRKVVLRVTDTGEGMPPEVRERVFEPFYTTKPEGKGTGLGLSTVYGIVGQAGGEIEVESEPGRGTRFEIRLPGAEPAEAERDSGEAVGPGAGGEASNGRASSAGRKPGRGRILVVENDNDLRRVARRILERDGFEVVSADSGAHALEALDHEGTAIDLIVTDVMMPGMTGPELVARVRLEHPGMRVLFSSSFTDAELEEHGLDPAARPFLVKPFTVEDLTRRVRGLLSSG